ncbi:MAG: hypothetical protein VX404_02715 [Planctomycetota bacterium]|nr:hypothetical protein [Planctomycetota bacterium]MEE2889333.1 hypothetical protein [Planctomycetota bacterium]
MNESNEQWQRKDALTGLLFCSIGALVTVYAYLAMRNDMPDFLWWPGWILGPILVLIGGNSIFRGLRGR